MSTNVSIYQLLASIFCGGLAGAILSIFINSLKDRKKKIEIENETINSLLRELRFCNSICKNDASYNFDSTTQLIGFPVNIVIKVTFDDRFAYPKLKGLLKDLEIYILCLIELNETITMINKLLLADEIMYKKRLREQLINNLTQKCMGNSEINSVASEELIYFPQLLTSLISHIESI